MQIKVFKRRDIGGGQVFLNTIKMALKAPILFEG
jgi:hypothetical protein